MSGSSDVGRLTVVLDARIAQFEQRVQRAEQQLQRSARGMTRNTRQIDASFAGLSQRVMQLSRAMPFLGAAMAGLTIGGISAMAMGAIRAAGDLQDMAQQVGTSTDALQVLQIAATQSGSSAQEAGRGVAALTRVIADAATGNHQAQQRFVDLGISFRDAEGNARGTAAVMGDLADRISRMTNPADQAAAATALLGTNLGQRLLPMLAQGREGLEGVEREARRMGRVLSEETVEAAARATAAFDDLLATGTSLATAMWSRLAPALESVSVALRNVLFGASGATRISQITGIVADLNRQIEMAEGNLSGAMPGGSRGLAEAAQARRIAQRDAFLAEAERIRGEMEGPSQSPTFQDRGALPPIADGRAGGAGSADDATTRRLNSVLQAEENRLLADRGRIIERNRTPEEAYAARLERLGQLVERFAGTDDALPLPTVEAEAIAALNEYEDAIRRAGGAATEAQQALRKLGEQTVENFAEAIAQGKSLREVARGLLMDLGRLALRQAISGSGVGKMFSAVLGPVFGSAQGNVFANGNVVPFAKGGVVGGPTTFPMADGRTGLMGEAGPEAIMPLTRGVGGKLGVRAEGASGGVTINQHMTFGSDVNRQTLVQWGAEIKRQTETAIEERRMESRRYLA